jgi:hypothetical protein
MIAATALGETHRVCLIGKVRHQSGVEKLKVLPEVKEGRPLDAAGDDRPWMAGI